MTNLRLSNRGVPFLDVGSQSRTATIRTVSGSKEGPRTRRSTARPVKVLPPASAPASLNPNRPVQGLPEWIVAHPRSRIDDLVAVDLHDGLGDTHDLAVAS